MPSGFMHWNERMTSNKGQQGVLVGEVASTDALDVVWLRLPGMDGRLTRAAVTLCDTEELSPGRRVAVMFQTSEQVGAVVLGPVVAELPLGQNEPATPEPLPRPDTLSFDAERSITLRCGKSSIQLLADGNVLIRGSYVLSRASGTNRIRGGNIQIN